MLPWVLVGLPRVTLNSGPQAKLTLRKSVLICLPSETGLDPGWGFWGVRGIWLFVLAPTFFWRCSLYQWLL